MKDFSPNQTRPDCWQLWDVFTCISHRGIVLSVVCHFRQLRQRRVTSMKRKIWYSDWLIKASKQDSVLHKGDLSYCWVLINICIVTGFLLSFIIELPYSVLGPIIEFQSLDMHQYPGLLSFFWFFWTLILFLLIYTYIYNHIVINIMQ